MKDNGPIKLGFVPDPPDERDLQFGAVMGAPPVGMPTWAEGYNVEDAIGPIRDDHQGYTLGCVSFGSTNDIETAYKAKTGKSVNLSQRWIYSRIHLASGGSSPRDAYKLLQKEGVCEDEYMPSNPGRNLSEAALRSESMKAGARENAAQYKIGAYYSIPAYNWDQYIQAIYQNKGCGFGYILSSGGMGHFVFAMGYKLINGNQAIVYHDSYSPFVKHMVKKGNNFYKHETGQQVQLYSCWTAESGDWYDYNMSTKLVAKKNEKEVFLLIAGNKADGTPIKPVRYWITSETALESLNDGGCLGSVRPMSEVWESIEEFDTLPGDYQGDIIGQQSLAQILKNIFGTIK